MKRTAAPPHPPATAQQLGDRTTVPFFLRGEASESVTPGPDQGQGTEASPLHEFVARGQAAQRACDEVLAQYYRERPSRRQRK